MDYWYRGRSENVQAAFDVQSIIWHDVLAMKWRGPEFDLLSGRMQDLGELASKRGQKQFRVLGCFDLQPTGSTLLIAQKGHGL
jgi:hypothetical protein